MKRSVALAGFAGLTLFIAGMAVALTGADDRSRLTASAVMVTGMATLVIASFRWASDTQGALPTATRSPRLGRRN